MGYALERKMELADGWRFHIGEAVRYHEVTHQFCYDMTKTGRELGDMDVFLNENEWTPIELPHDWNTREPSDRINGIPNNGYKRREIGWYFLCFDMPAFDDEESVLLEFEGVMGESLVYVNGARALRNHSGYNGFYADVTAYLIPDAENTLAVRVDTSNWEGWWYEGAGIYRPVHLTIRPSVHIKHLSLFAKPVKQADGWHVDVSAALENSAEADKSYETRARLIDANGRTVASLSLGSGIVAAHNDVTLSGRITAGDVKLWDIEHPNLYGVSLEILDGTRAVIDEQHVRCGFREIEWTPDRGMLLNGVPTPVNGICCHQDHAGVGIAVSKSIVRYRIQMLKAMGCNAYRCAHNMPWEYLLEVCDELGMLVMDENRHFNIMEETLVQVDDMVLRARNHPSVFLYALFNEEYWQSERRGRLLARTLARRVKSLDDSRATTVAMNGGVLTESNASDAVDVAGMNYFIDDYGEFARKYPGKPLIGTENGPIFCTRGESVNDASRQVYGGYGDCVPGYGNTMEDTMDAVAASPHVAGVFMWGGFDYRGEPYPYSWPSVFSHWGFCDMCGLRKDSSYLLESYYSDKPVLRITPHWNQVEGEVIRVDALTNARHVQLVLNGRALEEKEVVRHRASWQVPFEKGELCAKGVMANGEQIEMSIRTAGMPTEIICEMASAPGADILIFNAALVDDNGVPVLTDDRNIDIEIIGGELAGTGNGDPNAADLPDVARTLPTFHGRCQVLVKKKDVLRLRLSSDGLRSCVISLP